MMKIKSYKQTTSFHTPFYFGICLKTFPNFFKVQSNLPYRAPLYNKSMSIKGSLIFPINEYTAGNRYKQNSWFCKEIREDNFRFWWRRVHEDASQGMYISKIEIRFFTARILQNQRMLCCGESFHD